MSVYIDEFKTMFDRKSSIQALRNKVLELAIKGELVPQDPNDEPASELIKKIQEDKRILFEEKKIKKIEAVKPITDNEKPFDLPPNWVWVRIADVINEIFGGGTPDKGNRSYWGGDIPWASVKDIKENGKNLTGTIDSITIEGLNNSSSRIVSKGEYIIVTRMGLGRIVLANIDVAINQDLKGLIINRFLNKDYFYYNYKSKSIQGTGTTVKGIKQDELIDDVFSLPPLNEQNRIVEKIESLMSEIDTLEKALEHKEHLLELLPRAVVDAIGSSRTGEELKENLMFVINNFATVFQTPESMQELRNVILQLAIEGKLVPQDPSDEPASELVKKIHAERERLVKEGKIKKQKPLEPIGEDEIPFEIPESWKWVRLGEAIDTRDGTHDTPQYVEDGYPLITSKNISSGYLDFDNVKYISKEDYLKICERSRVDVNDILFAMIGTIGNPIIVDSKIQFAIKNVALFKPSTFGNVDHKYFSFFLQNAQLMMNQDSLGGVQKFVSLGYLRSFCLALPPLPEQHRIVEKVESIMGLIDQMEQSLVKKKKIIQMASETITA